jgi:hypothetical protein
VKGISFERSRSVHYMLLDSLRHTLCFGNHPKQQHHKSCKILQIFLATRPTHHCSHYTFLPYFSHIFFSYLLLLVTNIYPNFKKNRVSGLDHLLHLFVFHFLLHLLKKPKINNNHFIEKGFTWCFPFFNKRLIINGF